MKLPVLLVDDDATFRDRLARALKSRGVDTLGVATGEEALTSVRTQPFSGAVIDLKMPGMSGLELVRALRDQAPDLTLVVLTGFGSIATALEAVRIGARDYLTKPVDPDHLLAALGGIERPRELNPLPVPEIPTLDRVEWEHIQRVLAECSGNISQTARLLGLDRRSLQRKLAKHPPAE